MRRPLYLLLILICFNKISFGQAVATVHRPLDSAARAKQFKTAIDIYTQALKSKSQTKSSSAALHLLRGSSEAALKEYDKAITDYTAVISLNPEVKDIFWTRGATYFTIKKYELAINDFERALTYTKDNPTSSAIIYNTIAAAQKQLMQYDKAIESCTQAIVLLPNFGIAYVNRGENYAAIGQYQLGINDISMGINGYQDNKQALSALIGERADMKRMLKQYKDAINDFSYAIELNPNNKLAYWNRAAAYNNNGDYELASQEYTKTISMFTGDNRNLSLLYDDRAVVEIGLQQYKKAIEDDSLSISFDNHFGPAYGDKADAYAQNGDFQLSIDSYTKAISYFQNDKKSLSRLYDDIANEEYFLNDYQKVITASSMAISMAGNSWGPYLNRGRAYLKTNNKDLALNDFNKILSLDTTQNSFEYAFALYYTGNADKAIEVMKKNVLSTTNSYLLMVHYYNLACLFSLMDKRDEANIYLRKCIEGGYSKKYALADTDLDNIKNTQEYKDIFNSKASN